METYFSSHPGARKYSLAPIEHEDLLNTLFDGRLADGRHSQSFEGLVDSMIDNNSGGSSAVNGSSLSLNRFLEDEDSAGEAEDDELSQLSATSAV